MKIFINSIFFLISILLVNVHSKEYREEIVLRYETGEKKIYCKFEGSLKDEKIIEKIKYSENGDILQHYQLIGKDEYDTAIVYKDFGIQQVICSKNEEYFYMCKFYDPKNKLASEIIEGTGKLIDYYDNGNIKLEEDYLKGKKNGKRIRWYENGTKKSEENYLNDRLHGKCVTWFEDGKKRIEAEYVNDKLHGKFIEYYYDAKNSDVKETIKFFENGKEVKKK